jgi:hypothetical protein
MKLAVAASAVLASSAISGPWHPIASSQDTAPRTDAAVAKMAILNVHQLGVKVSVEGHPHVFGTVTCTHGARYDFYGWDYDPTVVGIHKLAVRVPLPAKCSINATARIAGDPVVITLAAYKR